MARLDIHRREDLRSFEVHFSVGDDDLESMASDPAMRDLLNRDSRRATGLMFKAYMICAWLEERDRVRQSNVDPTGDFDAESYGRRIRALATPQETPHEG